MCTASSEGANVGLIVASPMPPLCRTPDLPSLDLPELDLPIPALRLAKRPWPRPARPADLAQPSAWKGYTFGEVKQKNERDCHGRGKLNGMPFNRSNAGKRQPGTGNPSVLQYSKFLTLDWIQFRQKWMGQPESPRNSQVPADCPPDPLRALRPIQTAHFAVWVGQNKTKPEASS